MAGLNVCLYIIGLIYIAMNIFLIINLKKFAEKTKSNPLKEKYTEEKLAHFFYKDKNSFSYSVNLNMTRNLRYLMKDYECNEYKYKIENQKKDERQLSRVFSFDLAFINILTNIHFYSLIVVTIFSGISYIFLWFYCCIQSENCLSYLGCFFCLVFLV